MDFVESTNGGIGPVEIGIGDFETVNAEVGGGAGGKFHFGIVDYDGVDASFDAYFVDPSVVNISYKDIFIIQGGHSVEEIGGGDISDFGNCSWGCNNTICLSESVQVNFPDGVDTTCFDEIIVDLGGGDDVEDIFFGFGNTETAFVGGCVEGCDGDGIKCVCV